MSVMRSLLECHRTPSTGLEYKLAGIFQPEGGKCGKQYFSRSRENASIL